MKRFVKALLPLVIGAVATNLLAQETAYKALRVVGRDRGEKALGQIIAINGKTGAPQPTTWVVRLDDPAARDGVREIEITNQQVSGERAPLIGGNLNEQPIDLTDLNVDSGAAFQVANQEARRHQVGFDWVDYSLLRGPGQAKPIWLLELKDSQKRRVGSVQIAADSGAVISSSGWVPGSTVPQGREQDLAGPFQQPSGYTDPGPPSDQTQSSPEPEQYRASDVEPSSGQTVGERARSVGQSVGHSAERYGQTVAHFGARVWDKTEHAARRVGGWFQKQFTGRDTLSPSSDDSDSDDEDKSNDHDSSGDPYSRPVQPTDPNGRPVPLPDR